MFGFDISAEITKKLVASANKFAEELGRQPFEVQLRILYTKGEAPEPYFFLYQAPESGSGKTDWEKVREIQLSEIV